MIVLGELRDEEDCQAALQLVRTGHSLITTIHGDCVEDVLERFGLLGYSSKWLLTSLCGFLLMKKEKEVYHRYFIDHHQLQKDLKYSRKNQRNYRVKK